MVAVGHDGLFQERPARPFHSRGEIRVTLALQQKPADLALHGFQPAVGVGVGAEDVVVQFALEPQPAPVLVDRGLIDPARGAHLCRLHAEQTVRPAAGKIEAAFFPQLFAVGLPPHLAVVAAVVSLVEPDQRHLGCVPRLQDHRHPPGPPDVVCGEEQVRFDRLELLAKAGEQLDAALMETLGVGLDQVALFEQRAAPRRLRHVRLEPLAVQESREAILAIADAQGLAVAAVILAVDVNAVDQALSCAFEVGLDQPLLVDRFVHRAFVLVPGLGFRLLAAFVDEEPSRQGRADHVRLEPRGEVLQAVLVRQAGVVGVVPACLDKHRRARNGHVPEEPPRQVGPPPVLSLVLAGVIPLPPHEHQLLLFPPRYVRCGRRLG